MERAITSTKVAVLRATAITAGLFIAAGTITVFAPQMGVLVVLVASASGVAIYNKALNVYLENGKLGYRIRSQAKAAKSNTNEPEPRTSQRPHNYNKDEPTLYDVLAQSSRERAEEKAAEKVLLASQGKAPNNQKTYEEQKGKKDTIVALTKPTRFSKVIAAIDRKMCRNLVLRHDTLIFKNQNKPTAHLLVQTKHEHRTDTEDIIVVKKHPSVRHILKSHTKEVPTHVQHTYDYNNPHHKSTNNTHR